MPTAHHKGPAAPPDHGRAKDQLDPERGAFAENFAYAREADEWSHGEDKKRDRQNRADPEPPGEIHKLGVRPVLGHGCALQLKPHAADGAGPGVRLTHFGMHRAGVDRAGIPGGDGVIFAAAPGVVAVMLMRVLVVMGMRLGFGFRHQVHAAFGAVTRSVLTYLWMHRADVDGYAVFGLGLVFVVLHLFSSVGCSRLDFDAGPFSPWTISGIACAIALASGSASDMALLSCGMLSVVTTRAALVAMMSS